MVFIVLLLLLKRAVDPGLTCFSSKLTVMLMRLVLSPHSENHWPLLCWVGIQVNANPNFSMKVNIPIYSKEELRFRKAL